MTEPHKRIPWASVQRWNARVVSVHCPYCANIHTHGFGGSYSSGERACHCSNISSSSHPPYRFRYPFSTSDNTTVAYEIDKDLGFYVALTAEKLESDVEVLEQAFTDFKLDPAKSSSCRKWKSAREQITIGTEDEILCRPDQHSGGEDTFTLKRLDHVVSRMLFCGDSEYVTRYIRTSLEAEIFLLGTGDDDNSALNLAACERHSNIVKLLLNEGVNVDCQNNAGRSSLMEAALWGRIDNVKHLLEHGANKYLHDSHGRQAIELAEPSLRNDKERYDRSGRESQVYKANAFIANQDRREITALLRQAEDLLISTVLTQDQTFQAHSFRRMGEGALQLIAPVAEFPVPNEWKTIATLHRPPQYPLVAAMSGWSHKETKITVSGRDWTDEVMQISTLVEHQLQNDTRRDHGNPGQFHACHAEKQLIAYFVSKHVLIQSVEQDILLDAKPPVLLESATILVSSRPCDDCTQFINATNSAFNLTIKVLDRSL